MTADDPQDSDDQLAEFAQLASLLAARDEALAAGSTAEYLADTPPELQDEVQKDLATARRLRQVFRRSPPGAGAPTPNRLGRFELGRQLGRGGFGVVFLAYDPVLGREVALKVPRPEALVTPELRRRFLREAQAAAALDHPNIVPVYDAGEDGPICYIASAYCEGPTLAAWLRSQSEPVPHRLAAELVTTLAEAVEHAHRRGVLHRDLKPANILVGDRPSAPGHRQEEQPVSGPIADSRQPMAVKITDFGLAKFEPLQRTGVPVDESGAPTATGAVLGTPAYMAPEQAAGRAQSIGPGTDVYALGAILYELLTGRPPFQGESALETLQQARTDEPVAPRLLRPHLPRDLETICLKCLQKEPARRYVTAQELADDLRHFTRGEPIRARPVGGVERAWRWCRRNPRVAVLTAAIALLLVLGSGGAAFAAIHQARLVDDAEQAYAKEADARADAEENFRQAKAAEAAATREAAKAKAITQFLVSDILAQASPLRNPADRPMTVREALDRAAQRVDKAFPGQPDVESAVRRWIGDIYHRLGDYPNAEQHVKAALDINLRIYGTDHHETLLAMNSWTELQRLQGRLAEAEPMARQLVEISCRVRGPEDRGTLIAMTGLAQLLYQQGKLAEAEPLYAQALQTSNRVYGPEDRVTLSAMHGQAVLLLDQRRHKEAETLLRKIVDTYRHARGPDNTWTLSATLHLAAVLQFQRKLAEAETLFRDTLERQRRVLPAGHPRIGECLTRLGWNLHLSGQDKDAEPLLREAVNVLRKALPQGHWEAAQSESFLGASLMALQRFEEAEGLMLSSYETMRTSQGVTSSHARQALQRLISLYEAWGKPEQAASWRAKGSAKDPGKSASPDR